MRELTINEYKSAIAHLYPRQKEILEALYTYPNATATARQLAQKISPLKPSLFIVTGRIGRAGKRIANLCNVRFEVTKTKREIPSMLISPTYDPKTGWTMHKNLQRALEEMKFVIPRVNEIK